MGSNKSINTSRGKINEANKFINAAVILWFVLAVLGLFGKQSFAQTSRKPTPPQISSEFPFESKFVEVHGAALHYVELGEGDPILFLHGNPTSSYLWRNILPYLQSQGRVIALDNIGFGKSSKPQIEYKFRDHIRYLEGFIKALNLKNITLVVHDWGSVFGLDYASRYENNIKGLVMMEALIPPFVPLENYEALGSYGNLFKTWRDPVEGSEMLIEKNIFIEQLLPKSIVRDLTLQEMDAYRAPFIEKSSRKSLSVLLAELPIGGAPKNTTKAIEHYGTWLKETSLPKLHIYASPGGVNSPKMIKYLITQFKNYETVYVGLGLHFIQEDQPEAIGRAISDWYRRNQ